MARTLAAAARRLNRAGRVPALLLLTDEDRLPDPTPYLPALGRAGGGVILRYRDPTKRMDTIRSVRRAARRSRVPILLAGPISLARRLGLDGVHLSEAAVRAMPGRLRRPGLVVTCAAHDRRALARAARVGVDAALVSPVFPTASHPGGRTLGALRLRQLARDSRVPVIALGGIEAANVGRLGRDIAGIAAIGALARELEGVSRRSGR